VGKSSLLSLIQSFILIVMGLLFFFTLAPKSLSEAASKYRIHPIITRSWYI
jgi:hypothetical protein